MSKVEVFGVSSISFSAGIGSSLIIPNFYETLNQLMLATINRIVLPYYLVWLAVSILFILFFALAILYYEEQVATLYRIFWIWGTAAAFSWFGGVIVLYDVFMGLLLWGLGFLFGLFFRWVAPPLTKFLLWRDVG